MLISVGDVARETAATLVSGDPDQMVRGVTLDSREAGEGVAFVAFKGERVDGNTFAATALKAGATAVVLTAEPSEEALAAAREAGGCILRAEGDDGTEFMLRLAAAWRDRNPQWTVVGVTGSVGKTTTKDMLANGLSAGFRVHATKGNFNNLLGVPLTLFAAPDDAELLVVEMGMNHPGEIERISRAARPNVAVVTNVGTSHIGILGSRENIARAKAEVVANITPREGVEPCLVLSGEDDFTPFIRAGFCEPQGVPVLLAGSSPKDDVRCSNVELDEDGMPSFDVSFADGHAMRCTLPLPGRHMVQDFALAMAVAWRLGVGRDAAAEKIAHMPATHMRLEVLQNPGTPRVVDDSYNASPSSIAAALDVLCAMRCEGRRVAVIGEVGELGDQAEGLHGLIGSYAAAKPLDMIVFVGGENARHMANAARTMGFSEDRLEVFPDASSATRALADVFSPQDLVLVKASRSVGLDAFAKGVLAR